MIINIEDWTDLAWFHVSSFKKRPIQGIELEDLFQCAMLGILLASRTYDETQGTFPAYAYWFVRREMLRLTYRSTSLGQIPRVNEVLCSDLGELEAEDSEHLLYEDETEDLIWAGEFLSSLPLEGVEKSFFYDMVMGDEVVAMRRYRELTGHTRQRAYQLKRKVRGVAERHYRRLS